MFYKDNWFSIPTHGQHYYFHKYKSKVWYYLNVFMVWAFVQNKCVYMCVRVCMRARVCVCVCVFSFVYEI